MRERRVNARIVSTPPANVVIESTSTGENRFRCCARALTLICLRPHQQCFCRQPVGCVRQDASTPLMMCLFHPKPTRLPMLVRFDHYPSRRISCGQRRPTYCSHRYQWVETQLEAFVKAYNDLIPHCAQFQLYRCVSGKGRRRLVAGHLEWRCHYSCHPDRNACHVQPSVPGAPKAIQAFGGTLA